MIPQNARVVLIPDGSLNALNFETLLASAPTPHFWIEDVTLTTAASLQMLAIVPSSADGRRRIEPVADRQSALSGG